MENKLMISSIAGTGIALAIALLIIPTYAGTDTYFINSGSGSGNSTESTQCINLGTQYQIILNSTAGNCYVRSLANGTNITMTTNSTHIIINSTGGESTVCTNLGSVGEGVYASGNCNFKKLLAGTGISLSANGTRITITNTLPESTACNNIGTGNQLCSGGNINMDTLIAGTGITISDTTDDWTFASQCNNTGTGQAVCESSNNINSLIGSRGMIIADTTGDLTLSHVWKLLCQNSGTGSSVTCSFDAYENIFVRILFTSNSGGTAISPAVQFNGDTGTNYSWRNSFNGGADATSTTTTECRIRGTNTIPSNGGGVIQMYIMNIATERKVMTIQEAGGIDTSDATAPSKNETTCKWDNATNQITEVNLMKGAGTNNYSTGTQITVWGYNWND